MTASPESPAEEYVQGETSLEQLIGKEMPKGVSGPPKGAFKPKKSNHSSNEAFWVTNHASLKLHWRGPGQCYRTPGRDYERFSEFQLDAGAPVFGEDYKSICRDCFESADCIYPQEWILMHQQAEGRIGS